MSACSAQMPMNAEGRCRLACMGQHGQHGKHGVKHVHEQHGKKHEPYDEQ